VIGKPPDSLGALHATANEVEVARDVTTREVAPRGAAVEAKTPGGSNTDTGLRL
jgi:hypothetical protein